jgi:hypothetical protein
MSVALVVFFLSFALSPNASFASRSSIAKSGLNQVTLLRICTSNCRTVTSLSSHTAIPTNNQSYTKTSTLRAHKRKLNFVAMNTGTRPANKYATSIRGVTRTAAQNRSLKESSTEATKTVTMSKRRPTIAVSSPPSQTIEDGSTIVPLAKSLHKTFSVTHTPQATACEKFPHETSTFYSRAIM